MKKKRNKKYTPKPNMPRHLACYQIACNLYTNYSKIIGQLKITGEADYLGDEPAFTSFTGEVMSSVEFIRSSMRFLAIYEDNQKISYGIDYMSFEKLAIELEEQNVNQETVRACEVQIEPLCKAYASFNYDVSTELIGKFRLQSEEELRIYEQRAKALYGNTP